MRLVIKTLYLSKRQLDFFEKKAKLLNIRSSELIRRALDKYVDESIIKEENKK